MEVNETTSVGHDFGRGEAGVAARREAEELVALAGRDRAEAEHRFACLSTEEKTAVVCAAPAEDRIDLILLAESPEEIVPKLPARELYEAVQHMGKWESQEVVEHVSETQLNFMLDHDCWKGEKLDTRKFTDWLRLLMECDDGQVFRLLTAINVDLLAYYLKRQVRFNHDVMINDDYYCDPGWITARNTVVREFLERLYAMDPNLWVRLLGWVRMHSRGTMEADAVAGRDARLLGRGIPPPTLAISIYYPVPVDISGELERWRRETLDAEDASECLTPALPRREALLLGRAIRREVRFDEFYRVRMESQLLDIANKVIIADNLDIGDLTRRREALDKVRRWTNLGLEFLARDDEELAAGLLREQPLEYFFRLGSMLFDALGTGAVELEKKERRSGGRLARSRWLTTYFSLIQPEPRIPGENGLGSARAIASLLEYRYAWQLVGFLEKALAMPEDESVQNRSVLDHDSL
ncbi:MAG: hypothetical protein GXP31_12315 [Kiritimatiellaeota bacterium]|nr:hypothetical protein [Kiritimatiellota bacterium]